MTVDGRVDRQDLHRERDSNLFFIGQHEATKKKGKKKKTRTEPKKDTKTSKEKNNRKMESTIWSRANR